MVERPVVDRDTSDRYRPWGTNFGKVSMQKSKPQTEAEKVKDEICDALWRLLLMWLTRSGA